MKIYTSYFGNLRKLRENNIVPVSIARWKPKFYEGATMLSLAPTVYMLKQASEEEYLKMYDDILHKLDLKEITKSLYYLGGGNDIALLCYEKPGDFCHRHLLADFLNKNGYEVSEFGVEKKEEKKEPEYIQTSLF